MINYIIQIVLFQVLFLAVYDLFLKKETFFKWNRAYLLVTPILSFIIPLLKFESIQKTIPQDYVVLLPEVVLNPQILIEQTVNSEQTFNYLNTLFYVGAGFFLGLFLMKLVKVIQLISSSKCIKKENYNLILLENKQSAFSFFNYIFIDKSFIEKEELHVIEHELIHSKQYHTVDLLFFELLKVLMWFNPMTYIYQKRITLLHEYISDAEVVKESDKKTYFNNLLATTFNVENISFVNQFYKHSLIKKRIIMITKEKSKMVKQLKYLLLIPLLGSMLFYISCSDDFTQVEYETSKTYKQVRIIYQNDNDGGVRTMEEIDSNSYFDLIHILGEDEPNLKIYMISYDELSPAEKEEFNQVSKRFGVNNKVRKNNFSPGKLENGRKIIINRTFYTRSIDYANADDVPFAYIDKVPQFPGCTGDNEELKDCLNRGFQEHVQENFNISIGKSLGLSGKVKIYIQFKITKTGDIIIIGARAPHKELEVEAKRVVNSLPKMIPGEHNGKKVNVTYMLPIAFNVE